MYQLGLQKSVVIFSEFIAHLRFYKSNKYTTDPCFFHNLSYCNTYSKHLGNNVDFATSP